MEPPMIKAPQRRALLECSSMARHLRPRSLRFSAINRTSRGFVVGCITNARGARHPESQLNFSAQRRADPMEKVPPVEQAARERIYFAERFFGDFLFSTSSIACPPGVACTLLSRTISFAVTS